MTYKRMKEIQIKADEFRQNCKVIKYGITNIFDECDRSGFRLVRYPIGHEGVLGFVQVRDEDRIIFSNSSVRLAREIFTIAHEIGHMSLHMEMKDSYIDDAQTLIDYSREGYEAEANYFAACLLMPEDKVQKYISLEIEGEGKGNWTAFDIARMMTAFNVSFDMILHRLQNLNIIDEKTKARLDNEKNLKKVTNLLRLTGGDVSLNTSSNIKRIPGEYMEWVIYNYNYGIIPQETLEKALAYFDINIEDISDKLNPIQKDIEEDLDALIGGIGD